MKAVVFDGALRVAADMEPPESKPGWALLRVLRAGICRTDLEIVKGYMGYRGILGHEFVATVAECEDETWLERRVVGEINAGCGHCDACRAGLSRHCAGRQTLGIFQLNGAMAEYCALPTANLHRVPDALSDDEAVFIEPLAAAYEILDQVPIADSARCVVVGDGKLGILCAWVLSTATPHVTLWGHHPEKLELARWNGLRVTTEPPPGAFDMVVEATGRPEGFNVSVGLCKPRGTLVLKSTIASAMNVNLTPVVVNEITVMGSRCGRFEAALAGMARYRFPVARLVTARYPLDDAAAAFERAAQPQALKVLLDIQQREISADTP
jgi:alcohol dehydrogenase